MKAKDLKPLVEDFQNKLREHSALWNLSLDEAIPDYAVSNQDKLQEQSHALGRVLGKLRPYLDKLHPGWVLQDQATGMSWDALHNAVGLSPIAQVKGPSLQNVIEILDQVIGRLEGMNADGEISEDDSKPPIADEALIVELCRRIPNVARKLQHRSRSKPPFQISDEYDVQDLLHSVIRAYIKYSVQEDPLPKVAGSKSSRADISIEDLGVLIEIKYVRNPDDQKRIVEDFSQDLVLYAGWHPLKTLVYCVYNSCDLQDPEALQRLSGNQVVSGKSFRVYVVLA